MMRIRCVRLTSSLAESTGSNSSPTCTFCTSTIRQTTRFHRTHAFLTSDVFFSPYVSKLGSLCLEHKLPNFDTYVGWRCGNHLSKSSMGRPGFEVRRRFLILTDRLSRQKGVQFNHCPTRLRQWGTLVCVRSKVLVDQQAVVREQHTAKTTRPAR